MPTIAIVGASLTGSSAAATLREEGFDGRVVLIAAHAPPPPHRAPGRPDPAGGRLRGPRGAHWSRAPAPVRSAAALQELPARDDAVRENLAAAAGVLSRARHRDAPGHDGDARRRREADAGP